MTLRSSLRLLLAVTLFAFTTWVAWAQQGLQVIPPPAPVVDATLTLTRAQQDQLEQQLRAFKARKGAEISVIIVPTTQPETIEQYAIRLRDAWKAGRAKIDDAAQLIIAKNDRKLRIEVGYGLEGGLTDATAKRIISEVITPQFKHGDFAGGIQAGVEKILSVVDGEALPPPQPEYGDGEAANIGFLPIALLVALFAGGILRSMFGRLLGAALTGGLTGFIGYLITGTLVVGVFAGFLAFMLNLFAGLFSPGSAWTNHRRSGGGGYYGGGFPGGWSGGSWGGGGGGGGSWGGGGGGGGGGGASGDW